MEFSPDDFLVLCDAVEEFKEESDKLNKELQRNLAIIEELRAQLLAKEEEEHSQKELIKELEDSVCQLDCELTNTCDSLAQAEAEIIALHRHLGHGDGSMRRSWAEAKTADDGDGDGDENEDEDEKGNENENEVEELRNEVRKLKSVLAKIEADGEQKDRRIISLQQCNRDQEKQIKSLMDVIASLQAQLQALPTSGDDERSRNDHSSSGGNLLKRADVGGGGSSSSSKSRMPRDAPPYVSAKVSSREESSALAHYHNHEDTDTDAVDTANKLSVQSSGGFSKPARRWSSGEVERGSGNKVGVDAPDSPAYRLSAVRVPRSNSSSSSNRGRASRGVVGVEAKAEKDTNSGYELDVIEGDNGERGEKAERVEVSGGMMSWSKGGRGRGGGRGGDDLWEDNHIVLSPGDGSMSVFGQGPDDIDISLVDEEEEDGEGERDGEREGEGYNRGHEHGARIENDGGGDRGTRGGGISDEGRLEPAKYSVNFDSDSSDNSDTEGVPNSSGEPQSRQRHVPQYNVQTSTQHSLHINNSTSSTSSLHPPSPTSSTTSSSSTTSEKHRRKKSSSPSSSSGLLESLLAITTTTKNKRTIHPCTGTGPT